MIFSIASTILLIIIISLLFLIAYRLANIQTSLINKVITNEKSFNFEELSFQFINDALITSFDGEEILLEPGGIERRLNFRGVLSTLNILENPSEKHPYEFTLEISLLDGIVFHDFAIGYLSPETGKFKDSETLALEIKVGSSAYEYFREIGNSLIKKEKKALKIRICGSPGREKNGIEKFMVTSIEMNRP